MTETTTTGSGAATHVEKKDLGTKVKEGAKNAVEKVRKMSDELVKKIKGKPKEEPSVAPAPTTTTPGKTTTPAK
jgi:hypothetical protein